MIPHYLLSCYTFSIPQASRAVTYSLRTSNSSSGQKGTPRLAKGLSVLVRPAPRCLPGVATLRRIVQVEGGKGSVSGFAVSVTSQSVSIGRGGMCMATGS